MIKFLKAMASCEAKNQLAGRQVLLGNCPFIKCSLLGQKHLLNAILDL